MGEGKDEIGLVRAARGRHCDSKDSCSCSPLYEGWGGIIEWWGEADDDGKGIRVVDEVNESKMAGGCT